MGFLNEISMSRMTPDQTQRALSWVSGMLSRNLRPEERKRFFGAKRELEGILENQQRDKRMRKQRGLLSELMQRQNPNSFLGERLTGAHRNIPGAEGAGVEILPEQVPGGHIRDFVPNRTRTRDRMIIRPEFLERWSGDI